MYQNFTCSLVTWAASLLNWIIVFKQQKTISLNFLSYSQCNSYRHDTHLLCIINIFSVTFLGPDNQQNIKYWLVALANICGINTYTCPISSNQCDSTEGRVAKRWAVAHHYIVFLLHRYKKSKQLQGHS